MIIYQEVGERLRLFATLHVFNHRTNRNLLTPVVSVSWFLFRNARKTVIIVRSASVPRTFRKSYRTCMCLLLNKCYVQLFTTLSVLPSDLNTATLKLNPSVPLKVPQNYLITLLTQNYRLKF